MGLLERAGFVVDEVVTRQVEDSDNAMVDKRVSECVIMLLSRTIGRDTISFKP